MIYKFKYMIFKFIYPVYLVNPVKFLTYETTSPKTWTIKICG